MKWNTPISSNQIFHFSYHKQVSINLLGKNGLGKCVTGTIFSNLGWDASVPSCGLTRCTGMTVHINF